LEKVSKGDIERVVVKGRAKQSGVEVGQVEGEGRASTEECGEGARRVRDARMIAISNCCSPDGSGGTAGQATAGAEWRVIFAFGSLASALETLS